MVAKKMPAYESFGDELSPAVAYLQAAALLDIAAQNAVESKNSEDITTVSALWMQLAERLMGGGREEELDMTSKKQPPMGFGPAPKEQEVELDE